jgi:hypothetical protein
VRAWLLILLCTACDGGALERSCGGARVGLCVPYEHADVTTASLAPQELTIADFSMRAQIHVELARCADAPAPHVVDLSAVVPTGAEGVQVMSLLTLMDGADGDTPGDDVIDVDVANPFIGTVPANTDITLRFVPRSTAPGGCTGGVFEQPYRTGTER